MPNEPEQQVVRVSISVDRMSAELHAEPTADRTLINEPLCVSLLMEAGVELTDAVSNEIDQFIRKAKASKKHITHTVALGTEPVHGIDGTVDWFVDNESDTSQQTQSTSMSHYEKSAFVMVSKDDVLGKCIKAEAGVDGRDVTGKTVPAKEPINCKFQFEETLIVTPKNEIIAGTCGVLKRENNIALIEELLIVDDNVDFSTGNISFNGDIEIKRDIRDRFVVEATGNITVLGFIEDASIKCGGDLTINKGFAGRTRADATVTGSLKSHYLDNVDIEVHKDLEIKKEAINSRLTIHGKVSCPSASIIGGSLTTTKQIDIATLGSEGNVTTQIILGNVPRLQPLADQLTNYVQQFYHHKNILNDQIEILNNISATNTLSPHDAEKHTEYMFDMMQIDSTLDRAEPTLNNLNLKINNFRCIELNVIKTIFPGVEIVFNKQSYSINDQISGPATIFKNSQNKLKIRLANGKTEDLSHYASVTPLRS